MITESIARPLSAGERCALTEAAEVADLAITRLYETISECGMIQELPVSPVYSALDAIAEGIESHA